MDQQNKREDNEQRNIAHMTVLLCYSLFSLVLIGEALLLSWERWVIPLIAISVAICWALHIRGAMTESGRLWVYSILVMVTFFYYGIHESSIYDMAPVACIVIMIFTLCREMRLIRTVMYTYYTVMIYHLINISITRGLEPNALGVSRTLLHLAVVFLAGWLSSIYLSRSATERQQYDRRIKELEDTNRRTEDFLTNVSHELRTPINVVTGITSLLVNKVHEVELRGDVLAVQRAGYRLFEQIGDILDYTEIDTGRISVIEEPYMLSSIIGDLVSDYHQLQHEEDKELIFDVDPMLPAVLLGDGLKIKKILRHLIGNAEKFTKKGGVIVHIYGLPKPYGINMCIEVEDTGIGMNMADVARIKERFYQANSGRARRAGGLGLGLSIVYGLVTQMNGFLQIDSEPDLGTKVRLSIPQQVQDLTPCVTLENRRELCIACYLRTEKYQVPAVREFYNTTITNMVQGLDVRLHRVSDPEDLKQLATTYHLTHIFTAAQEYEADPDFFEALADQSEVIVAADPGFSLIRGSRARILMKPLNCFFIGSMLAGGTGGFELSRLRMICPDVRVLVVDDESMNLVVAQGVFRNYGMTVRTAGGGPEAIRMCMEESFDIVFLDHMMPEMDGVECMKRLRSQEGEIGRKLTIVALTANAVSGAREMFLREGFDEFVAKPMERSELERVLRKVLPKSQLRFIPKEQEWAGEEGVPEEETVYTASTDATGQRNMTQLKQALSEQGIDAAAGIMYGGGDEQFYVEVLTKFAGDATEKLRQLEQHLQAGELHEYQIRAHALKSTAKMIGASELSDLARKLEEAAKRGDDAYVRMRGEALSEKYRATAMSIREILGTEVEDAVKEAPEIAVEELGEKLQELVSRLDTFEADAAERILTELSGYSYSGKAMSEHLANARQMVDDFDLGGAAAEIRSLMEEVGVC
ncbi:MAG: response regulator [Butyrivibrio sp.]|nr:response regulator [Butyrivibrio sp.]